MIAAYAEICREIEQLHADGHKRAADAASELVMAVSSGRAERAHSLALMLTTEPDEIRVRTSRDRCLPARDEGSVDRSHHLNGRSVTGWGRVEPKLSTEYIPRKRAAHTRLHRPDEGEGCIRPLPRVEPLYRQPPTPNPPAQRLEEPSGWKLRSPDERQPYGQIRPSESCVRIARRYPKHTYLAGHSFGEGIGHLKPKELRPQYLPQQVLSAPLRDSTR